jgi:rhomboid protease GluP
VTSKEPRRRIPITTLAVLGMTALITALQSFSPRVLTMLCRSPGMVSSHQWWRLFTAMFVHADGWPQIVFNFTTIAIIGAIVEQLYGAKLWLALYFVPGIIGETAGLAWQPYGAGASVAGSGLLGGLAAQLLRYQTVQGRLGGVCVLLFATALTIIRDIHGPPILAGLGLAFIASWQSSTSRPVLPIEANRTQNPVKE